MKYDALRKTASGLGFYLFFCTIAIFTVPLIMIFFSYSKGVNAEDSTVSMLTSSVASLVSMFVIGAIYCSLSSTPMNAVVPFKKVKGRVFVSVIFIGLALAFVSDYMGSIFLAGMSLFGVESDLAMDYTSRTAVENILYVLSVAIIPALVEEFAFRGILLGKLRKYGEGLALLVSALLFGLMHGNIIQIPFAFIIGLGFGFIVIKTNSLLPTIVIHFLNNFISVVISIIDQNKLIDEQGLNIIYYILIFFVVLGGIISALYLSRNKSFFSIKADESYSFRGSLRNCLTSTGMIFVILLLVMETVYYTVAF